MLPSPCSSRDLRSLRRSARRARHDSRRLFMPPLPPLPPPPPPPPPPPLMPLPPLPPRPPRHPILTRMPTPRGEHAACSRCSPSRFSLDSPVRSPRCCSRIRLHRMPSKSLEQTLRMPLKVRKVRRASSQLRRVHSSLRLHPRSTFGTCRCLSSLYRWDSSQCSLRTVRRRTSPLSLASIGTHSRWSSSAPRADYSPQSPCATRTTCSRALRSAARLCSASSTLCGESRLLQPHRSSASLQSPPPPAATTGKVRERGC